jgi:hypothetical protein
MQSERLRSGLNFLSTIAVVLCFRFAAKQTGLWLWVRILGNGSKETFRELVTRYLDLVYSRAIRLVPGDTHLAEDIAQTEFVDLRQKPERCIGDAVEAIDGQTAGVVFGLLPEIPQGNLRAGHKRHPREANPIQR